MSLNVPKARDVITYRVWELFPSEKLKKVSWEWFCPYLLYPTLVKRSDFVSGTPSSFRLQGDVGPETKSITTSLVTYRVLSDPPPIRVTPYHDPSHWSFGGRPHSPLRRVLPGHGSLSDVSVVPLWPPSVRVSPRCGNLEWPFDENLGVLLDTYRTTRRASVTKSRCSSPCFPHKRRLSVI